MVQSLVEISWEVETARQPGCPEQDEEQAGKRHTGEEKEEVLGSAGDEAGGRCKDSSFDPELQKVQSRGVTWPDSFSEGHSASCRRGHRGQGHQQRDKCGEGTSFHLAAPLPHAQTACWCRQGRWAESSGHDAWQQRSRIPDPELWQSPWQVTLPAGNKREKKNKQNLLKSG